MIILTRMVFFNSVVFVIFSALNQCFVYFTQPVTSIHSKKKVMDLNVTNRFAGAISSRSGHHFLNELNKKSSQNLEATVDVHVYFNVAVVVVWHVDFAIFFLFDRIHDHL